jgi:hypothetical protein
MRRTLIQGLVAGLLAALASIVYCYLYQSTLGESFDRVVNYSSIIGASILGCFCIAVGYSFLFYFKKERFEGLLNIVIVSLCFVSIMGPFAITLPLDIDFPELFPGLVVPMHFFPALAFFAISPFFKIDQERKKAPAIKLFT